jgi:hypothetical protein
MIRLCLSALLVGYLPGALLFRLPVGERARRAHLGADERVFWHVLLSVAWSLALVLALAACDAYRFNRLLAANAALCALAILACRSRLWYHGDAARLSWRVVFPIALIALGLWRFFPTAEYVIGGKDPGTYLNEGVQIAQRGSLVIHDPTVAAGSQATHDLFFPRALAYTAPDPNYESLRFMGFFVQDVRAGRVIGQFPHLYPASVAIGYGLDGLSGALRAIGVWAIVGVLAVYFAGARLVGRGPAFAAACLLCLHVIEVWFSRYPNSDIPMQVLLFAALLACARAHQDEDGFFAPVAGALAALLVFLRVDALLVILTLSIAAGLAWLIDRRRPRPGFVLVLAVGLGVGWLYLTGPMRAYFFLPRTYLEHLALGRGGLALAALVVLVGGCAWLRPRLGTRVRAAVPIAIAALLVAAAGYAAFLRHPSGKLTDYDAYALRWFTDFYLTWPAFAATLIGVVLVARRQFWREPAFLIVFGAFSGFYFYKIHVTQDHFWMTRHYLPVILPGALLLAAAAALGPLSPRPRGWRLMRAMAGAVLLVWLGRHYAVAAAPILPHVEYRGIIPYLEQLASRFTDRDLVLIEARDAQTDVHVLAQPLAYIYGRNVLALRDAVPNPGKFQTFLEEALTRYERVFFLGGETPLLSRHVMAVPIADARVQVPEYDAPINAYPQGVRRKDFDGSLYRLLIGTTAGPFALDIGAEDDLNVVRFFAKETTEGRTFRWTKQQSFVSVPGLTGREREVVFVLHDGGRPKNAPPATMEVSFDDISIGVIQVGAGFRAYTLPLPADVVARAAARDDPARLRLRTTTWNPHAVRGDKDTRDLGVMLDRVEVH